MKLKELTEGMRFGPEQYDTVLNDPLLEVSYEIEFVWPIVDTGALPDWNKTKLEILKQLRSMGLKTTEGAGVKNRWQLVGDRSIDTDNKGFGFELIAPRMDIQTALNYLHMIFEWMKAKDCVTNSSTGLHVNVSRGGVKATRATDPLKVVLLMGESFLLKLFQREANEYTRPHREELVSELSDVLRTDSKDWIRGSSVQDLITKVRDKLSTGKYKTVNLHKFFDLQRNSYYEFRMMGNQNYHLRFDEIRASILRFGFLLQIAGDPNAYRREYLQELGKLLVQALSATNIAQHPELSTQTDPIVRWATAPHNFAPNATEYMTSVKNLILDPNPGNQARGRAQLARYLLVLPDEDPRALHAAALAIKILLAKAGYSAERFIQTCAAQDLFKPRAIKSIRSFFRKAQS